MGAYLLNLPMKTYHLQNKKGLEAHMNDNYDKTVQILKRHTKYPAEDMNGDTFLVADLGLSSFDIVNIVCEFEDAFELEIPDKDIRKFQTIGDVVAYIEKQ